MIDPHYSDMLKDEHLWECPKFCHISNVNWLSQIVTNRSIAPTHHQLINPMPTELTHKSRVTSDREHRHLIRHIRQSLVPSQFAKKKTTSTTTSFTQNILSTDKKLFIWRFAHILSRNTAYILKSIVGWKILCVKKHHVPLFLRLHFHSPRQILHFAEKSLSI